MYFSSLSEAQVTNTATLDTTGGQQIGNTSIGAYLDMYYGYNLNEPPGKKIPYMVSMADHHQLNINLGFIDIRYQSDKMRARFVPGFGTYTRDNYALEPLALRNLIEASAGLRLSEKKNIWMDAGILGSPYTNESAISKDHLMYSRSLAPEYVPYYLAGIKFSFPLSGKLNFYLYLLNGWQQIDDFNNGKSVGTQLEYRPNPNNLINWNTYAGDERSTINASYRNRYFTDVFWIFDAGKKWSFTSCVYAGRQEIKNSAGNTDPHYWWQANFIAQYRLIEPLSISGRVEYFSDPDQIMLDALDTTGFNGGSAGLCINYRPVKNAMVRLEARQFLTKDFQFYLHDTHAANYMTWLLCGFTVWF